VQEELTSARRQRTAALLERIPWHDPSLQALPDPLRVAMAKHWARRARSEARVGQSLLALVPRVRAVGGSPVVLHWLEVAGQDEAVHSELCRRLAESYAGERVEPVEARPVTLPEFGCEDERLEVLLLVTGTCCINETLATAWLEANVAQARAPIARAANRLHLRDEIDHARLGWAHLASPAVDEDLREALADCVPRLLAANLAVWLRADDFTPPEGVPGHGVCAHADTVTIIERALQEVVLPGFHHVGVRVERSPGSATAMPAR
jgi:hypothetical protein